MNKYQINVRQDKAPPANKRAGFYSEASHEFAVTYTPVKQGIFNIYLFGPIEDASQFIPAIEVLTNATEADEVFIHISSDGGNLDATDTLVSAMHKCAAKVVALASGGVHSAASVILLNADEFSLSENCNFLIHNGSCGAGGKTSDFIAQSKHTIEYMGRVLRRTYKHFLTDDEIEQLIEGKDFWLNSEQFGERYEIRNQALMEEFEQAEADAEAATQEAIEIAAKPKSRKAVVAVK